MTSGRSPSNNPHPQRAQPPGSAHLAPTHWPSAGQNTLLVKQVNFTVQCNNTHLYSTKHCVFKRECTAPCCHRCIPVLAAMTASCPDASAAVAQASHTKGCMLHSDKDLPCLRQCCDDVVNNPSAPHTNRMHAAHTQRKGGNTHVKPSRGDLPGLSLLHLATCRALRLPLAAGSNPMESYLCFLRPAVWSELLFQGHCAGTTVLLQASSRV